MLIHIICLGNALHGDDGFGAALYRRLSTLCWPKHVKVVDGTASGGIALFQGCARALVLNALPPSLGGPGQVLRLNYADYPTTPHDPLSGGTGGILAAVRRLVSPMPAITILGPVAVRRIPFSPGLSPLVMAAVETVAAMVAREFGKE